ncbi:KR domain protein [Aspergillus sclerotialis]|uniref:KR domain protein n=1 Tax=Aspergillus sclerotialis TaxID=2070753 RepID=A0A3A2ZHX3_9EURO|nr:KR domain protein [Aspergillus sclerotialis]
MDAALGLEANLVDTSLNLYATHFDCNVRGPIFLNKAALPYLPWGSRIVFTSSSAAAAAARLGIAGHTVYGPTKPANEALFRVWAKELGHSHGITVNCVNPGLVATDQWFQMTWDLSKTCNQWLRKLPLVLESEKLMILRLWLLSSVVMIPDGQLAFVFLQMVIFTIET